MTLTPTLRSTLITFASFIFVITAVSAWTGPSVSAPDGNVSAPLTISATSQSKTGGLDVGWLSAVGAVKVGYTATACSAELAGSLRWNTGVMEYCNGTVWGPFTGGIASITGGSCGVGQVVKSISATGVVTCATVTSLPGSIVGGRSTSHSEYNWGDCGPSTTMRATGVVDTGGIGNGTINGITYICIKN